MLVLRHDTTFGLVRVRGGIYEHRSLLGLGLLLLLLPSICSSLLHLDPVRTLECRGTDIIRVQHWEAMKVYTESWVDIPIKESTMLEKLALAIDHNGMLPEHAEDCGFGLLILLLGSLRSVDYNHSPSPAQIVQGMQADLLFGPEGINQDVEFGRSEKLFSERGSYRPPEWWAAFFDGVRTFEEALAVLGQHQDPRAGVRLPMIYSHAQYFFRYAVHYLLPALEVVFSINQTAVNEAGWKGLLENGDVRDIREDLLPYAPLLGITHEPMFPGFEGEAKGVLAGAEWEQRDVEGALPELQAAPSFGDGGVGDVEGGRHQTEVETKTISASQEQKTTTNSTTDSNNSVPEDSNWAGPWQNPILKTAAATVPDPKLYSYPCYAQNRVKIYIYDLADLTTGPLHCHHGQWGVETLIPEWIRHSDCHTFDPEKADFFLVPWYTWCQRMVVPLNRSDGEIDAVYVDMMKSDRLTYFDRSQGADHIFLMSDQGLIFWTSFQKYIPNSIILTTEAFTPHCGRPCHQPWKDIVIPGHTDYFRARRMRKWNLPTRNRDLMLVFHGRHPNIPSQLGAANYAANSVRRTIVEVFDENPRASVGGFTDDFFERMGAAHFCLVPHGNSSWTNHLYNAFFAGCVPLLLSDNFEVPFEDVLDWTKFSMKWSQANITAELMTDLMRFSYQEIWQMREEVEAHRCWFDYALRESPDCSPYQGVMKVLAKKICGPDLNMLSTCVGDAELVGEDVMLCGEGCQRAMWGGVVLIGPGPS